jgi:hypothetical protein
VYRVWSREILQREWGDDREHVYRVWSREILQR